VSKLPKTQIHESIKAYGHGIAKWITV